MIVSIITCVRPVSYLDQTLENIKSLGIVPVVFKDHYKHSKPDNKFIALEALQYAYDLHEDLLFLEDDIIINNAALFNHKVPPDCLFTSFYNSYLPSGKHSGIRFGECQALLLPFNALKYILNGKDVNKHQIYNTLGFATVLRIICRNITFEVIPSMVTHIGDISAFRPMLNHNL